MYDNACCLCFVCHDVFTMAVRMRHRISPVCLTSLPAFVDFHSACILWLWTSVACVPSAWLGFLCFLTNNASLSDQYASYVHLEQNWYVCIFLAYHWCQTSWFCWKHFQKSVVPLGWSADEIYMHMKYHSAKHETCACMTCLRSICRDWNWAYTCM